MEETEQSSPKMREGRLWIQSSMRSDFRVAELLESRGSTIKSREPELEVSAPSSSILKLKLTMTILAYSSRSTRLSP